MAEIPGNRKGSLAPTANAIAPAIDQMLLPRFIVRQGDGLYVELRSFDSSSHFLSFIERIFGSGLRFVDLDYGRLQKLLYDWGPADIAKLVRDVEKAGKPSTLRLATDIMSFSPQRQQCYRNAKLIEGGNAAEYLFEPVLIERVVEEQVEAEPDAESELDDDDEAPNVEYMQKKVSERAKLNVDEFIAAMWSKDVRYGIDVALVKKMFVSNTTGRAEIARMREPTEGTDASVAELINSLHRNNAPKLLADGRVDLRQFQNRFPQVAANTRLIKKVPRTPGKPGWTIAGREIVPEMPRDFDIATLAGIGTRVERNAEGEFVVAEIGGFLQIDSASHSFSISEKIINLEGVSQRTTGNLALGGEEYEEHGIVQERAQIEGKHMTFMADVFGNIVSNGGRVVLKKNLMAGSVRNSGGVITVEGNASRATLESSGGEVELKYAESCRIVGGKVSIGRAIHCDILAQELTIETSEGCALAAHKMQVGVATARHDVETTISMLIPDLSAFAKQLDELRNQQVEWINTIQSKRTEIEAINSQQEIKTYLLLNAKLRAKELNMTVEQAANWQKLLTRVTPILQRMKTLNDELRNASSANEKLSKTIQEITRESANVSANISCNVAEIIGDTLIRAMKIHPEQAPLETLQPRELRARLRESGANSTVLFNGSDGEFEWSFSETGESEASE
jgi:uncharacterized protein (DUF342 family)